MISERTFAAFFSGFWTELLPMLTQSFVHMVNDGFNIPLTDKYGCPYDPVPKNPEIKDPSVIAEFAFYLARIAVKEKTSVEKIFSNRKFCKNAEQFALKIIAKYKGNKKPPRISLIEQELEEGFALAMNYQRFLKQRGQEQDIEFAPVIPGAGFLPLCKADLSIGNTLFEIKTVDRNLAGKDIRQIIIYLALQSATGERRWVSAGFFNPRRAIYHEFGVDDIVRRMSGRSTIEVFQDLIDFICTRDVQIDMAF